MVPQPDLAGGPEHLFRLGPVTYAGRTVSASMPAGPWLAAGDGTTPVGALGVLVDDVLGYALVAARPEGRWSVSAEITLDVLAPVPATGTLTTTAEVAQVDAVSGFATGRVTDEAGRLLAVGTQRGRFVAVPEGELAPAPYEVSDIDHLVHDVVAGLTEAYARGHEFAVPALMANPLGNVHGGMSLCLSELVAREAVGEHLTTASVHITYTRPIPVGARLSVAAEVRHHGRSLAVVDVTASLAGGKPATVTRVVLHPHVASAVGT